MTRSVAGRWRSLVRSVLVVLAAFASDLRMTGPAFAQDAGWSEVTHDIAKLVADIPAAEVGNFGRSVALDGDVAISGADSSGEQGAAFLYRRDPDTGDWEQEQRITGVQGGLASLWRPHGRAALREPVARSEQDRGAPGDLFPAPGTVPD